MAEHGKDRWTGSSTPGRIRGMALLAVMSAALWGCSEAPAGIGPDTGDPPGGTIVRTPAGEATGLLRETARPRRPWRLAARSKGTLTPGKLVHAR